MRITIFFTLILLSYGTTLSGQSYTYYPTGEVTDVSPSTISGTCMMGGSTESDEAMIWFLERAGGGNVVVIRASGSDGYNDYMYSELGLNLQSVETIVFNDINAAYDSFVHSRIEAAEAIWIAGGDQWDYVTYWRDTPIGDLLDQHINVKHNPIGGTSAGMAILGDAYYSAENGTVTSDEALTNPFRDDITLGFNDFMDVPYLTNVITDTHYDDPDRRGRQMVFLARLAQSESILPKGIACDESTAVCIDENGIARVFGDFPDYDDNAYFLQANCETIPLPEVCSPNTPLHWHRGQAAVKAYQVKGTPDGAHYFDLNDWENAEGGVWRNWWVQNGELLDESGQEVNCATSLSELNTRTRLILDQTSQSLQILIDTPHSYSIYDLSGALLLSGSDERIELNTLSTGWYAVLITTESNTSSHRIYVQ